MGPKFSTCLRSVCPRQKQRSNLSQGICRVSVGQAIFASLVYVFSASPGWGAETFVAQEWTPVSQQLVAASEASAVNLQVAQANQGRSERFEDFDHLRTGFPLTGAHSRVGCETCHVRGVFKGTPTQCRTCHSPGRGIAITFKPANHIPTRVECDQCHLSNLWTVVRFDHSMLGFSGTPQLCRSCHNGFMAEGKPINHILTNAQCDGCHSTRGWVPATFSHALAAPGSCATCHNGVAATGKPANHIPTIAPCDACHRTNAWIPATFDHANVPPGTCATCHNGVAATGKPRNHIPTNQSCDVCHSTQAWVPTR